MAITGITDAMTQYERNTESIFANKPKRSKAYGIKMPDSSKVIGVLAVLFVVFVAIAHF
jgi:hypothetical protein